MREFLLFVVGIVAGGVIVWLIKDTIQKWLFGADAFAARMQAKADAVRSALGR